MRAAYLLSAMFIIGGIAAAFGYPGMLVAGRPVTGLNGLVAGAAYACLPPLLVLSYRRLRKK